MKTNAMAYVPFHVNDLSLRHLLIAIDGVNTWSKSIFRNKHMEKLWKITRSWMW